MAKRPQQNKMTDLDLAERAMRDPVWWMEQCGWHLWEKQKEIVEALLHHKRVAVPAAFGVGKTYLAARIGAWWAATRRGSQVVTTAPTARQVKDLLWAEWRDAVTRSKMPLGGELLQTEWRLGPKGSKWFATGFATSPDDVDKFTGYHSPYMLVIFDQAAGLAKNAWTGGEGLLTSADCRMLAISNTVEADSEFANICLPDRKSDYGDICDDPNCPGCSKWKIIRITAHDSPNVKAGKNVIPGVIAADWIEERRQVWTETDPFWQIFVEAQFVESSSMTVFSQSLVKKVCELELQPEFDNIVIGLDVADQGVDQTVFTVRAGPRLLFMESCTGNDPMQVVDATIRVWKKVWTLTKNLPVAIRVDKIGVGAGVASRISQLGYPVIGINVGVVPVDPVQYLNLRAELSWGMRHLAEAGRMSLIPLFHTEPEHIQMLKEELTIRYKILNTGKIQIEHKDDIRKRLKRSSDHYDSCMLCFALEGILPVGTIIDPSVAYQKEVDLNNGSLLNEILKADQERALAKFCNGMAFEEDWREIR